jgi:hypothetical protein
MDLKGLLEIGKWSGDIVEKTVSWNGNTFEVQIKTDLTPADFEFIYAHSNTGDDSHMARRVSRSVYIADEPVGYDIAKMFKPSLLAAICVAINEVQNALGEAKKT